MSVQAQSVSADSGFSCQIALQGGGAKIMALLAAMEGIQKLQRDGKIRVTRVAGTSAGAITAALFAAGIDLKQARRDAVRLIEGAQQNHFPIPKPFGLVWKVAVRRQPLWEEAKLAAMIESFFAEARVKTLGDLFKRTGVRIHIVASVLSDARKVIYSDSSDPDKPIVAALLDSAAIPFCFRIWQKAGPIIVDGGLCENLPAEELLPHEVTDGPAVAFSFNSSWPGTQSNLREFSLALLETAMGNSVARARNRVGHERVHEITTSLTTFDFSAAARFADDEALRIRSEAIQFVEGMVKRARTISGDPWADLSPVVLEEWWRVYQFQHQDRKEALNLHSSVVVQANSLAAAGEPSFGLPDAIDYRLKFKPIAEMMCSRVSIVPSVGSVSLYGSEIEITTGDAEAVSYVLVPARDPENPSKRPALLFFTPPLQADSGPYSLRLAQTVPTFMTDLQKGRDELYLQTRASPKPVERVELILHLPKRFEKARTVAQEGGSGRAMSKKELEAYPPPVGFRAIGWCGDKIEPNSKFACDVIL